MRSKAEPPADAMRHSPHQLPWGLRCQERNVQQTPLSFARSARDEAGNRDSRSILVSLPRLTANAVLRSARRGRPGCFADLGVQRRGSRTIPRRTIPEIATARSTVPRRGDHNLSFFATGTTAHGQWLPGERDTTRTRHEAEPASSVAIVATSFHAADPTVDPNHDADIRIGSEAPKRRCPFLYPV
jgi:hypothetical protein